MTSILNKIMDYATPVILEEKKLNVAPVDVFSRLLSERIIFLSGEICEDTADVIVAQMLYLDSLSHDPIQLYINSGGGECASGLMIYDTMRLVKSPVHTLCMGNACSMAFSLLIAGNKRFSLPNARMMLHEPSGWAGGKSTDVQINAKELELMKVTLRDIILHHTKISANDLNNWLVRDTWFSAKEALSNGIIDEIK